MRRSIVLPAASGKSTMIRKGLPGHVVEADDICHYKETLHLASLREHGKLTGNWSLYEEEYGRILTERTSSGTIILLSSSDLARRAQFKIIGRFLLTPRLWLDNLTRRGVNAGKYTNNYESERSEEHVMVDSREELYQLVKELCLEEQ